MLIREIEPIDKPCVNLLDLEGIDILDEIIEQPLRKACKLFRDKGIETVMSSANKNNILNDGSKPIEIEDVRINSKNIFETHTFLEAGVGSAWIMINFDSLSDENKDFSFALADKLGSQAVWFVHPTMMSGNIEHALRTGKFSYDFVVRELGIENAPKNVTIDDKLIEFDKRSVVLLYPWMDSSTEALFLRMPVSNETTEEEVEEYFFSLAKCFNDQSVNEKGDDELDSCMQKHH